MASRKSRLTDQPAEQRPLLAIALRLAAAVLLALMFAGVKWAGRHGVGVIESLFYRQLGTALCALGWVAVGPGFGSLRTQRVGAHVARMLIGLVAMGLNFLAFMLLPLAEATTIGFSVPIFATMLAALVLGEPTGKWRWGAVVIGFAGVLVIVQPGSSHIGLYGGAVAIAAALTTACAIIAIRRLGATEAVGTTVFWFGASSLVPLALAMPFLGQSHAPSTFAVIAGFSLAGGLAQLALTGSLRFGPVALVMPMDYSSLLWASLLGWLLFAQLPSHWTALGAPIVIAAGLVILWREQKLRKAAMAAPALGG
ncbi:MAG TPA: DMT family transporter [Sphingomicrobium sp.]|jgi:drug/metabolite transporter (DMT)-like permease